MIDAGLVHKLDPLPPWSGHMPAWSFCRLGSGCILVCRATELLVGLEIRQQGSSHYHCYHILATKCPDLFKSPTVQIWPVVWGLLAPALWINGSRNLMLSVTFMVHNFGLNSYGCLRNKKAFFASTIMSAGSCTKGLVSVFDSWVNLHFFTVKHFHVTLWANQIWIELSTISGSKCVCEGQQCAPSAWVCHSCILRG